MNWLDEEGDPAPAAIVENGTADTQTITVGCRTGAEVRFSEEVSLSPGATEQWSDLPAEGFTIGAKTEAGQTAEREFDTPPSDIRVTITDDGIDIEAADIGAATDRHGASDGDPDQPAKGESEIFCRSCGEVIKQHAEICPECGVRNVLYEPAAPSRSAAEPAQPQQSSPQSSQQASAQQPSPQQSSQSEPSGSWATGVKISIGLYGVTLIILLATMGVYQGGGVGAERMLYSLGLAALLPLVQIVAWVLFPLSLYMDLNYVDYHVDSWPLHSRLYLAAAIILPLFLQLVGAVGLFFGGGRLLGAIIPVALMALGIRYLRARGRHL